MAPLTKGWAESVGTDSVPDAPMSDFLNRAAAEVDALHRLLQAWFRAEGPDDPAPVLAHFDDAFVMITAGG